MNFQMFKKAMLAVFLFGVLSVQNSVLAAANTNPRSELQGYKDTWWFNLGLGPAGIFQTGSYLGDDGDRAASGIMGAISFNYALFDNQLITVRATILSDIWGLDTVDDNGTHKDFKGVTEVGALYGLMHKNKHFLASIAAGLAYVGANYESHRHENDAYFDDDGDRIDEQDHTTSTIGIPLETQLFWTPTSFFGVGLIGSANINNEVPFAGVMLGVQFGDVR